MLFAELPLWVQDVLRDLSREGYLYIGRTGTGLSHAFRREPDAPSPLVASMWCFMDEGSLTECMKQGTIRAIEETAQYHDLAYKLLLEQIAILGPKWVAYEKIAELMQQSPVLRALREEI